MIRVGPAGWSYDDWNGIVYPSNPPRDFDHLAWLANYFDAIEINTSFYHIPAPRLSRSWVGRIEHPDFRFTAKLHRSFTHDRAAPGAPAVSAFRSFLEPMLDADRLGAVLVQFPWSFRYEPESLRRMESIFESFSPAPLAVEVRHASFDVPAFREFLAGHGISLVDIDQPSYRDALPASGIVTANPGYIRLHGRNREKWFRHDEAWERYDYLYDESEMGPWVDRAKAMAAEDVFVIMNNHFRGQAVVNALEMKGALGEETEVPPDLAAAYPGRFDLPRGAQFPLFDQ